VLVENLSDLILGLLSVCYLVGSYYCDNVLEFLAALDNATDETARVLLPGRITAEAC
jgi:hypothetical protein